MSQKAKVLVVDDEPDIRELVQVTLNRMNLDSVAAENLSEARRALKSGDFDLCLTDMQLPDGNGMELVHEMQKEQPELPIAVITAFGSVDLAVEALKAGAFDFVSKPVQLDGLRNLVNAALRINATDDEAPEQTPSKLRLLGESPNVLQLRALITKLARSQAPVYISGESGTGKELVARLIHDEGPRTNGPFIPVNCGAIPPELMESEFFGHMKGSFTGANTDKEGLFQAADRGTLFLDEVADLPLGMQVKLLRAIQEKAVRPVGAREEASVDVRILSATHKNIAALVDSGDFRQDLFYRLNVIEVAVPPLRDRGDDIVLLAEFMLDRLCKRNRRERPRLTPEALASLCAYSFPGNVRELENILERSLTLCEGLYIGPDELILPNAPPKSGSASQAPTTPAATTSSTSIAVGTRQAAQVTAGNAELALATSEVETGYEPGSESLDDYVDRLERGAIVKALDKTSGNKTQAAKLLGITFRALRYKLEKLEID